VFFGCTSLTSVIFAAGSAITSQKFGARVFPEGSEGDGGTTLRAAYLATEGGGAGTYTRGADMSNWTKQ